ncbi:MAG: GNAT family N-acetyltransferase [Spirochaetes bacterium]|nr:GNAT family N-acetyltransferase [Spirochaetota bacterium]
MEKFKTAEKKDISSIVSLMKELYQCHNLDLNTSQARQALDLLIENSNYGRIWLILQNEKVIGYMVLTFGFSLEYFGKDAFLDEIFIREDYRSLDIGQKAYQYLEKTAKKMGIKAIHLEVKDKNTFTSSRYRKWGFKEHKSHLLTKWIDKKLDSK